MLSRTKLFLILFFLPAWIASLLQWGDDRTSSGFATAPLWFYRLQLVTQFGAILLLFLPPRLRPRPSLAVFFFAVATIVGLSITDPILEGEFVLISGSMLIALIALFLAFVQPDAIFAPSDIAMLFYLFLLGFVLQVVLYVQFGIMPSHSSSELFIRFNGITNDSLASGFVISMFIPWAVTSRWSLPKVTVVIAEAIISGSLFAVIFVPLATLGYLVYRKHYKTTLAIAVAMLAVAVRFYTFFSSIIEIKLLSIMTHLRFFLNISGANYQQSKIGCSEEFCESFLESGLALGLVYVLAFYALLLCFVAPLFRKTPSDGSPTNGSALIGDTLRIYGASLVVGTFVHPVPLIPFAIPLFMVVTSLYLGRRRIDTAASDTDTARPIPFPGNQDSLQRNGL